MKVIDQNNAAAALERALIPGPDLIDGRTETERLNFLSGFAALLNFYDGNNQRSGSWQPFLLKDPVFLLASISHTDYRKEHRLFVQTCANLQEVINDQSIDGADATEKANEMIALFNQLFDQLTRIFLRIERWTYYMQLGSETYDLKKYVLDQVKETYSSYLWAILSLRDYLAGSSALTTQSTDQVQLVEQYVFDAFTDEVWTKGGGSMPYMQVLGLYSINDVQKDSTDVPSTAGPIPYGVTITTEDYFNGLKNAGDLLFKFYRTIVHHSASEYGKEKNKKSRYPDTLLLRAFGDLLKVHQEQLNGVANKHLDFYYTDILKQTEQPAVADSVFITVVLGKNITLFDLPAGTEFNAGNDAQKNPILFASKEDVVLNAAVISAVYTLAPATPAVETGNAVSLPQLYLQSIATPGVVATNEAGEMLSWGTFGGMTNSDGTAAAVKNLAFSFGSPMLFLPEGVRQITVHLVFENEPDATLFTNAQIFLSTATAWLPVTYSMLPVNSSGANTTGIQITLDAGVAPIVPFTTNPDGVNSTWPMFKLVFGSYSGLAIAPVLTAIEIDVCVTGVNTFALYNDNGLLSTKNPFQLFGPVVNLNSNFLIGSSEIFSKPLNWLSVEIDWDTLPPAPTTQPSPAPLDQGFGNYYYAYNSILFPTVTSLTALTVQPNYAPPVLSPPASTTSTTTTENTEAPAEAPKPPSRISKFFTKTWNVIKWPVSKLVGLFSKKKTAPEPTQTGTNTKAATAATFNPPAPPSVGQQVPFANIYFTVGFSALNYNVWNPFLMYNYGGNALYATWLTAPCSTGPVFPDGTANSFQLFDTAVDTTTFPNGMNTKSVFGYFASKYDSPAETDPTIQQAPLTYDGTNASGFIKMTLTNPANGFGPSVYAGVVTDVVTQNALKISGSGFFNKVKPSDLISAANPPFAPKVQAISAMYSASQTYDLTKASENYPLQYFYYTPFASYTAYDNSPALTVNYSVDISMIGDPGIISGLQLVPSFTSNAPTEETALACAGALYIGLTGLLPGSPISLFFELATTYSAPAAGAEVNYYYLSTSGWKPLSLQKDGTNQFTCSGIVTLNIPSDIALQDVSMPLNNYWIAIGASMSADSTATLDLSSFAQVVLLAPNGVELTRSGTTYLTDTTAPVIASGAITKPETAIAQIGSVAQPFSSFGGRAAEDREQMYTRVSRRLKTKDRAVSGNDMFTLITQQFPDIYFSGSVFSPDTNVTTVYVVEGFDSYTDANAYRPLVSACEMNKIGDFLKKRVSLFSNIAVSNYTLQQVSVKATVTVKQGYVPATVSANISQALNILLSPWIANSGQEQVSIGQPVTGSQIAAFIRDIAGVVTVTGVELYSTGPTPTTPVQTITPATGALLVSSLKHTINTSLVT